MAPASHGMHSLAVEPDGRVIVAWLDERYLKAEKDAHKDRRQRTLTHLVVKLGMSETDVMDSAFRSKHVDRKVTVARDGKADEILLEYKP